MQKPHFITPRPLLQNYSLLKLSLFILQAVFSPSMAPIGSVIKTTATAVVAGQPTVLYSTSSNITNPELQMYKVIKVCKYYAYKTVLHQIL